MGRPLISIVMVNYNHEEFIKDAIDSVLQQTYDYWELIIVDDGSTDSSVDIIRQYNDPRIRLYAQKENRHICAATNLGLGYVNGEFVARLDSDDVWRAYKLEKQIQYFEENPDASICFTKLDIINNDGEVINQDMEALYKLYNDRQESREEWIRFFFFYGNSLIQSTMMMRKEVLDSVGGFNLAYMQAHDFDFFVRAIQKYDFSFIEEPLIGYRRNECQNSAMHPKNNHRFFNEHMNIRYHFFEHFPEDLFIKTFGDYFVDKDSKTHEELLCEQAFLLCKCIREKKDNPLWGLMKLEELLKIPHMAELLKNKYNYTPKVYYEENTRTLFYTREIEEDRKKLTKQVEENRIREDELEEKLQIMEKKIFERDNHIQMLLQIKEDYQKNIEIMENSRSWKLTRPLRAVRRKMRREKE